MCIFLSMHVHVCSCAHVCGGMCARVQGGEGATLGGVLYNRHFYVGSRDGI